MVTRIWVVMIGSILFALGIAGITYQHVYAAGSLPATLQWSNPSNVTDQLRVEKSASIVSPFTILKDLPANTITYTDATNGSGETACYRVAYFNAAGVGPYAGPVCKIFPTIPGQAPAAFTVN